jgi:two-component system, OmpR family, response regulator
MNAPSLLLAEDDAVLADALVTQLTLAGFRVEHAPNGAVAEFLLMRQPFDAAVLDLGLPLVDGLSVLKRVRVAKPALPVLILTAQDGLDSRVAGFQAGADDYLTKPFDFPELELRLRALLRRSRPADAGGSQLGGLVLDHDARRASVHGVAVDLSPREWLLLDLLLAQQGKVVGKERIAQAWSVEAGEAGSTEVYIHRLRRKLEGSGLAIRTVRGLGYLLEPGTA